MSARLWVVRVLAILVVVAYWIAALIIGTPWWWQW